MLSSSLTKKYLPLLLKPVTDFLTVCRNQEKSAIIATFIIRFKAKQQILILFTFKEPPEHQFHLANRPKNLKTVSAKTKKNYYFSNFLDS